MTENLFQELSELNQTELRELCASINISFPTRQHSQSPSEFKSVIIRNILSKYYELCKYMNYSYVRQLGVEGKDGRTFLARSHSNGKTYAVKIFKSSKSSRQIETEAKLQRKASRHKPQISPSVIEYSGEGKYIVMDAMDKTLFDVFKIQKGTLTISQQKQCVQLFRELDTCGIFHGDPNPLNFMFQKSRMYMIDYGFAKEIDAACISKYGRNPNMSYMVLGLYLKLKSIHNDAKLYHLETLIPTNCVHSKQNSRYQKSKK